MKALALLVVLLFLLTHSTSLAQEISPTIVVPGGGIGAIRLGMDVQEAYKILGRGRRTPYDPRENPQFPFILLADYGAAGVAIHTWFFGDGTSVFLDPHIFVVENTKGKVSAVGVQADRKYRTSEGVGIGSSEAEIRQRFGVPDRVEEGVARRLFYLPTGIRFKVILDERGISGTSFEREALRGYQGTSFDIVIFCKWKRGSRGWETGSDC